MKKILSFYLFIAVFTGSFIATQSYAGNYTKNGYNLCTNTEPYSWSLSCGTYTIPYTGIQLPVIWTKNMCHMTAPTAYPVMDNEASLVYLPPGKEEPTGKCIFGN